MKKTMRVFFAVFIFVFGVFMFCAQNVFAKERIISFDVIMTVNLDGSAVIEENIEVNAEHKSIKRGIYRDLPNSADVPIEFISLQMDGRPEPSFTENRGGNLRINFGSDDFIPKGIHKYKLAYSIKRLVRNYSGKDYDEVYWNVAGHDNAFAIENASFKIIFPQGVEVIDDLISIYCGREGSKSSKGASRNGLYFKTEKTLPPGAGLTVAIPFKKGVVNSIYIDARKHPQTPVFIEKGRELVEKGGLFYALFVFACLMIYIFYTWKKVGEDPDDAIATEFSPPANISPAFLRCVWKKKYDERCFASALTSLAMKGKIEILEKKRPAVLRLKNASADGLPQEEIDILNAVSLKGELRISDKNWADAIKPLLDKIESFFNEEKKKYLIENAQYVAMSILFFILFQFVFIFESVNLVIVNLIMWIFAAVFFKNKTLKAVNIFVFAALCVVAVCAFSDLFRLGVLYFIMEAVFLLAVLGIAVYSSVIDNLTQAGRALMIKIKGFYRYMSIAEEHRVALSNPLDAERIFADYLPYAFAFGMENKWMDEFEKILPKNVSDKYISSVGGRTAVRDNLIASSLASAAPRSSGSGGGGSSGGGFGGGGSGGR